DIDVHFRGRTITSGGHGFCGIGRKRLLNILQSRCEQLGVELVFDTEARPRSRARLGRAHCDPPAGRLALDLRATACGRQPHRQRAGRAFVVVREGVQESQELVKELQDFVKQAIAPYKYPGAVEFRKSLPRTETGKPQRFKLRAGTW